MDIFIWIGIFIISLFVLIKSSEFFTEYAEKVGIYFGMPTFIFGVTIVSIGTSLPELISSIFAVIKGSSEIVVGNVIGSNIANIFLVLGIAAIICKKLKISYELSHVDFPLLIGSTFLLSVTILDGIFTISDGILCLFAFLVYLLYTFNTQKTNKYKISSGIS